jgi:iron complex outermembrane receptor protein
MKYIFTAMLLFVAGIAFSQNCDINLHGHVEDPDTREKLSGATVIILELNKEITTDAQGDFQFNNLCPGTYTLSITHVGCDPVQEKIKLTRSRHIDIDMPHQKNTLSEVVVNSKKETLTGGDKKEISGLELEKTKGQNLAEALSRINGISLLQTGSTVSKPVYHGLHGSRILTINNGVRQEGQQWGNEHAPEIDPFIAGKLQLIKGVDELRYGSDAIGGVILVEPKTLISTPGYKAEFNAGYFTNNRQWIASAMYEQQLKNLHEFSYRIQGTFKKGANASTPDYRLNNTASEEKNFSVTAGWKKHQFSTELFYSFFDTRLGIFAGSHIGNLTDLTEAINSDEPADVFTGENSYQIGRPYQAVQHHLIKSKTGLQRGKNKFGLLLSFQNNFRQEFDIVRNSDNKKPQLDLAISTISEELSWERSTNSGFTHLLGFNATQQENRYAGRYFIPAYRAYNYGGYYIGKWSKKRWETQAGVRFDSKNLYTNRILSNGDAFDEFGFNFNTVAASANIGYKFTAGLKSNINMTMSTRAPQVNELLSNGIHHGAATFESGDIYLKSERSFNTVWVNHFTSTNNRFSAELSLYNNRINNFIYQQPVPDQPVLTVSGAFPLLRYKQNDANLRGLDLSTRWEIIKHVDWEFNYNLLRAKNIDSSDWLIRMPADRIKNSFSYHIKSGKRWTDNFISIEHQYVFKQTRTPDESFYKQDYKDAPPAYGLIHLDAGTTIQWGRVPLSISLGVRNLLDKSYRDYLNSMRYFSDETGRSFQIRIKIPLQHHD